MTSISIPTERRIDDFYLDLRDYVALVFDGDPEEVSLCGGGRRAQDWGVSRVCGRRQRSRQSLSCRGG